MRATEDPSYDSQSSISLRIVLNPAGQGYRVYRALGHIKIGCAPYGIAWRTDVSPSPQNASSAPMDAPSFSEKTTRVQLEAEVLALLKRLGGAG